MDAATETGTTGTASSTEAGNEHAEKASASTEKGTSETSANTGTGSKAEPQDETEEVKVGGLSAKLDKKFAKTVKELERGFHQGRQFASLMRGIVGDVPPQELAKIARAAEKDPSAVLEFIARARGLDLDEISESRLARKLEQMQMTPEQRELAELKAWKEQQEQAEREAKENAEREEMTKAEQKESQALRTQMLEAWKDSGLPSHPYFGQVIAATMLAAAKQGQDLSAKDAAGIVKKEFEGHVRQIVSGLDAEKAAALLGDDVLKKIREYEVKRVTGAMSASKLDSQNRPAKAASTKSKEEAPKVYDEYSWSEAYRTRA